MVDQIADFAYAHPKEILFVQVSRLTEFDPDSNAALVSMMEDAFGSRMVPRSVGTSASLADIWATDRNVIVIYDDDGVVAGNPNLWDNDTIYQPWWNVQTMDDLYLQNQASLAGRPRGQFGASPAKRRLTPAISLRASCCWGRCPIAGSSRAANQRSRSG